MRQHIIVPFDGSISAQSALLVAIEMARKYAEKIILINVQPSLATPSTTNFFHKSDILLYQEALHEDAIKTALHLLEEAGIEFEAKLMIGIPKNMICEEAKARQIRCIIMGSRGHSAFVGGVLGSVSQGVMHLADCPVMVVPANSEHDQ
ncbi:MAG TPA: universal stress protein [Candidatus Paenibacillus intestinavium]|nr:universal stress protein [Candidatus Paenibacillus intestinavium]